jgi:hypothetical protein
MPGNLVPMSPNANIGAAIAEEQVARSNANAGVGDDVKLTDAPVTVTDVKAVSAAADQKGAMAAGTSASASSASAADVAMGAVGSVAGGACADDGDDDDDTGTELLGGWRTAEKRVQALLSKSPAGCTVMVSTGQTWADSLA